MFVGSGTPVAREYLSATQQHFKDNIDQTQLHRSGVHKVIHLGTIDEGSYWKQHQHDYYHLQGVTYPASEPIYNTWIKYVDSKFITGDNGGGFMGLHQDFLYERKRNNEHLVDDYDPDTKNLIHTNSIILDRSDDLVGGELVLAGDSMQIGPPADRGRDTRDLMYRLKVVHAKEIGDLTIWNGLTVHGVAEVTKGWRATLIVVKKTKYDDNKFMV